MIKLIYPMVFSLFSIYVLLKTIYYGIYEIKQENNKSGGIVVITFSTLVIIFSNIMFWMS